MRKVQTLIFVGCISFAGFTVHAQQPPGETATPTADSLMQDLLGNSSTSGVKSVEDMLSGTTETDTTTPPIPDIENLLTTDAPIAEVNVDTVEAIDSRTGRYPPRLKINFTEFPLRSLESASRAKIERNGEAKTQADIVVRRIQSRLHLSQIDLVVKDRTATLSGTVETERQRSRAELMLRFEPGIDIVHNELTVISPEIQ